MKSIPSSAFFYLSENVILRKMLGIVLSTCLLFVKRVVSQPLKYLTIILSVCNYPPAITPEEALHVLVSSNVSVKSQMKICSKGKITFDTLVFPRYVQIPCETYTSICDVSTWSTQADNALKPFIDVENYSHRIYILPMGVCSFGGLGVIGPCFRTCDTNSQCVSKICRVWISGESSRYPIAYLHEIGHNQGLQHATYNSDEYGDFSDLMGLCCDNRCYNAVHLKKLGIDEPKSIVVLPFANSYSFNLITNEYVEINEPFSMTHWYVQFRKSFGADNVRSDFEDSLNVYSIGYGSSDKSVLHQMLRNVGDKYVGTFVATLNKKEDSNIDITLT